MARELEYAATGNDWRKVREGLPPFLEAADKLLRGISVLLHERMPEAVAEENKPLRPAPDAKALAALYKASLSCSRSAMEEHLQNLEQYRYQSGGELVAWLRARVDAIDYDLINERLAESSR
jgi:predicted component of type VI protein secretion system